MRRAALLVCLLGCYPSSDLTLPPDEGYLSRIILGSGREAAFVYAAPADAISAFSAGDELLLEALLYRETLAELGLAEGQIPIEDDGRPPPRADAVRRTTITGGDFSGWDSVEASELAQQIRIPHFDANACSGCLSHDENREPICKLDCKPATPEAPLSPFPPVLAPVAIPPDCPTGQVAYPGEDCHGFGACPADGWPTAAVDAYVRPGSSGNGTRASPFGTVTEAIDSGAERIGLSTGTHTFDGFLQVPVALYGACAEQTIVEAVLRMREDLILHDVTVMGGIETCRTAEVRRVHVYGGPMLGERATILASDVALHDSYVSLIDSDADYERLFISSELGSFTCFDSRVRIDGAYFFDSMDSTLSVGSTCSVNLTGAVLRPWLSGAIVDAGGHLEITRSRIEGREGGIVVVGTASIAQVSMIGDEGLEVLGIASVSDSIIESIDLDSGAVLINDGHVTAERIELIGGKRGILSDGITSLSDVTIATEAFGMVLGVGSETILSRASITARVTCVEALSDLQANDLALYGCETGLSSSATMEVNRVRTSGVGVGSANFSGTLTIDHAFFEADLDGIDGVSGSTFVRTFVIEGADRGATLRSGTLSLEAGLLSNLEVGLRLPSEIRPEEVLEEVSFAGVSRVFETSD